MITKTINIYNAKDKNQTTNEDMFYRVSFTQAFNCFTAPVIRF